MIFPERDLTTEEMQIAEQLRLIFLTGNETLEGFTVAVPNIPGKRESLKQWLDSTDKILMFPARVEGIYNAI